jgi:hypothetical protein
MVIIAYEQESSACQARIGERFLISAGQRGYNWPMLVAPIPPEGFNCSYVIFLPPLRRNAAVAGEVQAVRGRLFYKDPKLTRRN